MKSPIAGPKWHNMACRWLLRKSWNFLHMSWRTCKTLLILEFSLVPSYEDLVNTTNSPSMNANMCLLCISLILLVLLATYLSLETALWICWHCNGGKIKFPVNNRLLDSQQAFDFHLKYLEDPKKLRIWMNEDSLSTCPHNSGSCAFMLNIVSKFIIHIWEFPINAFLAPYAKMERVTLEKKLKMTQHCNHGKSNSAG